MMRIVLLCFLSLTTYSAHSQITNDTGGSIGIEIHSGNIGANQSGMTSELNDIDTLHYLIRYDYNFTDNFSLGLGYLNGDSSDYVSFVNLFTNSRLEYYALMLNARIQFKVSKRNRLFFQASAIDYDYDIIDNNNVVTSRDDNDYAAAIGWTFRFKNGLGLNAGYNYTRMGSDIRVRTAHFGFSYLFQ